MGGEMSTAEGHEAHVPVMADRVVTLLGPALRADDAVLVDATLGRAGHARLLLDRYPGLRLIGVDRDGGALRAVRPALRPYGGRVVLVRARFDEAFGAADDPDDQPMRTALDGFRRDSVDGVLFDLGVSSPQLDEPERGFSYAVDTVLDMRMDDRQELTAWQVVNEYPARRLAEVLSRYGEERFARRIAESIARERERHPIETTGHLVRIIAGAIPAPARRTGGNPAKRTFQAVRIEVNGELTALRRALPMALDRLAPGGRLVVLSYHSLEDRIAKRALADASTDRTPLDLPVSLPDRAPRFRLLTRGAQRPGQAETEANPRAASARLRAVERIGDTAQAA